MTDTRAFPLRLYFFASFAALGVYAPFFPRWLTARGIDGVALGAIVAAMPAMSVVGPPVVGLLADTFGLRSALLRVACAGSLLTFALLAAAGFARHPFTFGELLGVGLVFAAFRAPMLMMADVMAIEREGSAGGSYGGVRLWGSLGFLVASVGGGRCLDPRSATDLPVVVSVPLLVALVSAFAIPVRSLAPRAPPGREVRALLGAHDFPLLLVTAFVAELSISSYELCYSLHLADLGASSALIGLAWGLPVIVEILVMGASASLLDRFRAPPLLFFALVVSAIRCALLAGLRSLPSLLAVQLLHAPSIALFWISGFSYLKQRTPPQAFATAQGLFSAAAGAGSVAGVLTWGALYRHAGGRATFSMAAVVATAAAVLALRWSVCAGRFLPGSPDCEGRSPIR